MDLFPPSASPSQLASAQQLVGIARLAAEGTQLAEKRSVEYRTLPTRKWLNRCHSQRVAFTWTINPYRGCEYGCKYCYARFTHEFLERRDPLAFETEIYAKDWDPGAFRKETGQLRPGQSIGLGTATDPYQPAERRFGRTRQVLEALADIRDQALYVTTKSDLVSRDADLLARIARHNLVRVSLTVTTLNPHLARLTEPMAPRPDLRVAAAAALSQAGVAVSLLASPVLPLLTDNVPSLSAIAKEAKRIGAVSFGANVLFLRPSTQQVFFPFLAAEFPEYLGRYRASYRSGAFLKGEYPEKIAARVARIRADVGLNPRDLTFEATPAPPEAQLSLF